MPQNTHWYNRNENRPWPLVDGVTGLDDSAESLPSNILADLHIAFPRTLGNHAFISSVSVTQYLVSLTIMASESPNAAAGFVPLAALTLSKPVEENRVYRLEAQSAGVSGWVVWGTGIDSDYRGLFSSPAQTRLAPKAARVYDKLPVTNVSKLHHAYPLTGLVKLSGQEPIEIVGETRQIEGVTRQVAVVRLVQTATQPNVFQEFAGDCGGRPESRTCGEPEPIEFINSVGPDCDGQITIKFEGCGEIAELTDLKGVLLDCSFGLLDVCIQNRNLPNSEGEL